MYTCYSIACFIRNTWRSFLYMLCFIINNLFNETWSWPMLERICIDRSVFEYTYNI